MYYLLVIYSLFHIIVMQPNQIIYENVFKQKYCIHKRTLT